MFDLKRPCSNCPFDRRLFRKFDLGEERVKEIVSADAFQCHKTVDYENINDPILRQGKHPQQCAGLMALLHAEGKPNQIMQVAQRLVNFDAGKIDNSHTFNSINEIMSEVKGT